MKGGVLDTNNIRAGNIYGGSGASLGLGATGMSMFSVAPQPPSVGIDASGSAAAQSNVSPELNRALQAATLGKPVVWWLGLLGLLVLTMFVAKKLDGGEGFSNIKLSAYNVLIIGLASIVGMTFWKLLFTKLPVPGLSTIVLAA